MGLVRTAGQRIGIAGEIMSSRRSLLSTTALSALLAASGGIASAPAADMAVKALPRAQRAALYSWTGFYLGANVGATAIDSSITETSPGGKLLPVAGDEV